ncbi:MAG: phosphoglucosamine mutase [Candidatus Omnitrophica bacterium]|nr:phosphoglucosamine mutase [Candidatus Omnitrophota bacterium]
MIAKLFGTDGIRGEVGKYPLTQEGVFNVGQTLGLWLKQQFPQAQGPLKVIIGKDTRESGEQLERALTEGLRLNGLTVQQIGVCSTPAVAYLTCALGAHLGVAISASHNPGSDNGIKLFNSKGYKLFTSEEQEIETAFSQFPASNQQVKLKLDRLTKEDECLSLYTKFAKSGLNGANLSTLTVVLDCAFGSLSKIAPQTFRELGAKVVAINTEADGKNINVNCGTLYPQKMAEAVLQHKADVGIAFDGDGDRLMLSDEQGNILDGDQMLAILSKYYHQRKQLAADTVVCTLMSNIGLEVYLKSCGLRMVRTKVGDKYVLEEMLKQKACLGGEQSGHIIILQRTTTGDGLITALELIKIMLEANKPLSKLAEKLEKFPQVLLNVKVKERKPLAEIPGLNAEVKQQQEKLGESGRISVRYSGTEKLARVMVEGRKLQQVRSIAEALAKKIEDAVGEN